MDAQEFISPEDQSVTFVELFFDLVFVFSVTQVVDLLHHGLSYQVVGQAVLVFWLVWWGWTQFTWALNAANTDHSWIQLGTLVATAVAFFMAVALPQAFGERAFWFAITYVVVRTIGLVLYYGVAASDPKQRSAVRLFGIVSVGGLIAVLIGGLLGGPWQLWLWAAAIFLDVVAALVGARVEGWNIHPEHFSERHGLFVIIALGETLIVAAGRVSGASWTQTLLVMAILAVAVTCALWWSYFPRAKPVLDSALEMSRGAQQSQLARDVYSLLHFPMILGIIAFAFSVGEGVTHAADPLAAADRIALAVGLLLFVGGMAAAIWRATKRLLWPRLAIISATAVVIVLSGAVSAVISLALALVGVLLIVLIEQRSPMLEPVVGFDLAEENYP